jgi:hypothetical protein
LADQAKRTDGDLNYSSSENGTWKYTISSPPPSLLVIYTLSLASSQLCIWACVVSVLCRMNLDPWDNTVKKTHRAQLNSTMKKKAEAQRQE